MNIIDTRTHVLSADEVELLRAPTMQHPLRRPSPKAPLGRRGIDQTADLGRYADGWKPKHAARPPSQHAEQVAVGEVTKPIRYPTTVRPAAPFQKAPMPLRRPNAVPLPARETVSSVVPAAALPPQETETVRLSWSSKLDSALQKIRANAGRWVRRG